MLPGYKEERRYFIPLITAAIGGLAAGAASSALGYGVSRLTREDDMRSSAWAHRRNIDAYANRYRMTMHDMKQAGLNPILAASGGFSIGDSPRIQAPMMQNVQGQQPLSTTALQLSQTKTEEKKAKQLQAQAKESYERAKTQRKEQGRITAEEKAIHARIQKTNQEIQNLMQEWALYSDKQQLLEAQTKQYKVLALQVLNDLRRLTRISDLYDNPYGHMLMYLRHTFGSLPVPFMGTVKD